MAKKSVIARAVKREKMHKRYQAKREILKAKASDISLNPEERWEAQVALQKLPINSSRVRLRDRCRETGRPRGTIRKIGLCHAKFREFAMRGEIPGLVKSSW